MPVCLLQMNQSHRNEVATPTCTATTTAATALNRDTHLCDIFIGLLCLIAFDAYKCPSIMSL